MARYNRTFTRFLYVFLLFLIAGAVSVARIITLQVSRDRVTIEDVFKKEELHPTRGSILSYDGKLLAVSVPVYRICCDPSAPHDTTFSKYIGGLSQALASAFPEHNARYYRNLLTNARKEGKQYIRISRRMVDFTEKEAISRFPMFEKGKNAGGFIAEAEYERENPYGKLAHRTIGRTNVDGGITGIELKYDFRLRGKKGFRSIYRTAGDRWLPANGAPSKPAEDGTDIRTTIDIRIQEAAETELRRQLAMSDVFEGATAIVMDVRTGAVRGVANMKKMPDGTFSESFDYAAGYATEPGSTLKLASLMAMIEDGHITLDTPVDGTGGKWSYAGITISDSHDYGKMTALEAFEKSSNVGFAKMITESYGDDPSSYIERLHNMKLVEKLNLDIGGEGYATITTPDDGHWSNSTLASLGYGYALTLTPLHILTFYNAVANGGKMMRPYFIEDFEKDGIVTEESGPSVVSGSICSKSTLREVRKALRGVVEEGTARLIDDSLYQIAGKTGTAWIAENGRYTDDHGYRRFQASFAGYFPADNPKYSCIVVLYSGKTRRSIYGATWAAPVFKRIADKIYVSHPEWNEPMNSSGSVPPDNPRIASGRAGNRYMPVNYLPMRSKPDIGGKNWVSIQTDKETGAFVTEELSVEQGIVPDVTGMGLKDAIFLLENEGYRVVFSGAGRVSSQTPSAGSTLSPGERITLTLK
ncbi:MAG TPA: transpeptidase family protein [Candidatus Coprenecus pullistercoris]|nr:transpeptidase family protein [Candidatus Coprenecus pullistercoris]